MNLADAIRLAAQTSGSPLGQPEPGAERPARAVELFPAGAVSEVSANSKREEGPGQGPVLAKDQKMRNPHEGHEAQPGHNVVRLELVLAPEQLKGFFGAVIKSQHSVLTLREAANLLRVSQKALEGLAFDGDVPGMMVDGKWRFTRQALEDWLSAHPKKKEA